MKRNIAHPAGCGRTAIVGLTMVAVIHGGCNVGDSGVAASVDVSVTKRVDLLAGELELTPLLEIPFSIRNQGTSPMTVSLRKTSCGCQGFNVERETIEPGSAALATMEIRPPTDTNEKSYRATVETESGGRVSRHEYVANVTILADWEFQPERLAYDFSDEVTAEVTVSVRRRLRSERQPTETQAVAEGLPDEVRLASAERTSCALASAAPADEQCDADVTGPHAIWEERWQLGFTITPSAEGDVDSHFTLRMGETESDPIPLRLRRVAAISVHPVPVRFGRMKPGEQRRRSVLLHSQDGIEFSIVGAECGSAPFAVEHSDRIASTQSVTITFEAKTAGTRTTEIVLATSHPNCETVSFEVSAEVE